MRKLFKMRANELIQCVVLATKPDYRSSIFRTQMVEKEPTTDTWPSTDCTYRKQLNSL